MSTLQVCIYDKRIDCAPYNGFYHATFDVEYHEDIRTPDNPPFIIIASFELHCVSFQHDRNERAEQFIGDKIPMIVKSLILSEIDFEQIKERAIDEAATLTSQSFKQLL